MMPRSAPTPFRTWLSTLRRRPVRLAVLAVLSFVLVLLAVGRVVSPANASTLPALEPVPLAAWSGAERFDVVVTGSEPEGVIAAVAAAQEGKTVLLVTRDARLGGLFVPGKMNSLDLRTQPELYQRGLFETWWNLVGRGSSFDVQRAENAFERMLHEAGVQVVRSAPALEPLLDGSRVTGVRFGDATVSAGAVIDATSEMDVGAAAGAPYSMGWNAVGLDARMVDTLVFRIDDVDWPALQRGIRARGGRSFAEINDWAAWGHFGGYPAAYRAVEPGIRLRGLNLGLQEDGSVLVNALMIEGIDPFDEASRQDGAERATREAPRIIEYLKADLPGFENASFGGVAEALYIRETRHLEADCILTIDDVFDNRVTGRAIAAGGYPLDVHPLTPNDTGFVFGVPEIYGAELCMTVTGDVDGLWVVGKAAGFDALAASSARVVPFGMAVAEAVGVAAAKALQGGVEPAAFAAGDSTVAAVRDRLRERGAYLPVVRDRNPVGPHAHPHYAAYRLMLSRGLATGGYENQPRLDDGAPAISYVYLLANVLQRFHGDPDSARRLVANYQLGRDPLEAPMALNVTAWVACRLGICLEEPTWEALQAAGVVPAGFAPAGAFTRGDTYALAAGIARLDRDEASAP